jgi:hypothetical protein
VRFYLDNGIPHTTAIYRRTLDAVRASGAQYLSATSRTITLAPQRRPTMPHFCPIRAAGGP